MARVELELDDKGELTGTVPPEVEELFKRTQTASYGQGYGKGVATAAEDAKKQIEETVKAKLAEKDALAPLEKARIAGIEEENARVKKHIDDQAREFDRTSRNREETHAKELIDRSTKLEKRDGRIRELTKRQIRGEALQHGARDESLDELEVILNHYIGYDDDMQAFIKDAEGNPQLQAGKPIPISAFVKQYLDNHAHHRKPTGTAGGGARGGAAVRGSAGQVPSVDAAKRVVEEGDRSPGAINDLFNAGRKKTA